MRLLHALFALLTIAASYALFRQLLPRRWAFFAGCLLGLSHSLLMISRLAMRENTAVLFEVVALALSSGACATSTPSSPTPAGSLPVSGSTSITRHARPSPCGCSSCHGRAPHRHKVGLRRLVTHGSIAFAGLVLVAAPLLIAGSKAPPVGHEVEPVNQLLITREGSSSRRTGSAPTATGGATGRTSPTPSAPLTATLATTA